MGGHRLGMFVPMAQRSGSITATVLARHNKGVQFALDRLTTAGARLSGPATLDVGERIRVMFEIAGRPYDVAAEVVTVEHASLLIDRIAVRFMDLSAETRDAIRDLITDRSDLWGVEST
jgi:hypothetical protein